jgi:protein-tyrosine phosphatase
MRTILFLCTGNYYRSRFAEQYFNHLARQVSLPWLAVSRGLATERGVNNVGPISPFSPSGARPSQCPDAVPLALSTTIG